MNRLANWCFGSMPAVGFGGACLAAADSNAVLAWTAAGIAAAGLVVQGVLSWYRQARDAKRTEDKADLKTNLESIRLLNRMQLDLEHRITRAELAAVKLGKQIELVRCVFPDSDGSPRCHGREAPPERT